MNPPKNDSKYEWTRHSWEKMKYYGISESRIKRIIRFPKRTEEGVAESTVAVMSPAETKNYQEIWVMYKLVGSRQQATSNLECRISTTGKSKKLKDGWEQYKDIQNFRLPDKKIKIITAWRYPGKSPERDPIPSDILSEIRGIL